MKNLNRTYLLAAALTIVAALALASVAQAQTNLQAVKKGISWTRKAGLGQYPGTGFQTDAISALAAARKLGVKAPPSVTRRFANQVQKDAANYAITAGATAKLILASTATGANPRCFGPPGSKLDLHLILKSNYNKKTGQYGKTAFDQGLAMVALKAEHARVPSAAVKFVRARRGQYGWNFALSKPSGDDVESTAILIEGMRAAGVSRKDSALKAAYKWMTFQRNPSNAGGGGYNPDTAGGETQANTTAYAIRAADAMGVNLTKAKRALRALQKKDGRFRSSPSAESDYHGIATSDAIIALAGSHYPVVAFKKPAKVCADLSVH
jgi:hypothetical protein